jgi:hypothetical protein
MTISLCQSLTIRFFTDFLAIGWMAMISLLWYSQLDHKRNHESAKPKPSNWPAMLNYIICASNCNRTFYSTALTPSMRLLALSLMKPAG